MVALCSVLLTIVAAGASAPGDTLRISVANTSGAQATDSSVDASISGNGNLVAFKSNASNLIASDTNGTTADIFLRDRSLGTTTLVSRSPSGSQFTSASEEPAVSYDGSTVTWETGGEVYVRKLSTGVTTLVSKTPGGAPAGGVSHEPALSADGRYVAYWSTANDIGTPDPAFTADVFVYDTTTGTTELVSVGSGNTPAAVGASSFLPALSGDGRYVSFETEAPFSGADTNGTYDVYVRDRQTDTTRLVSHTPSGAAGNAQSFEGNGGPVISQDGSTIAFGSDDSDLVAGDGNARSDVFVWHRATDSVERVSVTSSGAEGIGNSSRPAINADGSVVAFESESPLHPWDTNGDIDIYVRHLGASPVTTTLESLSSSGQSVTGNKLNPSINGDGTLVAYHSPSSGLVSADTNGRDDVFVHELGVADTTPPVVTGQPTTPPNADGWFNQNVVVQWTAVDPEPSSGQPAPPPNDIDSVEGQNVTFSATHPACDANANCTTGTIKLSIDKTPPHITANVNQPNAYGWYNGDVVAGFTCTDALSGVASCPAHIQFTSEGANQQPPAPLTATDRAGNTATASIPAVNIDHTPPVIHFTGATSYDVDGTVSITCSATDSLSGVAPGGTCQNVVGPASLFQFGANTIIASVTDKAGNTASAAYTFTVQPTIAGLERYTCAVLGYTPASGHDSNSDHDHDNDVQKRLRNLCRQLTDDLEDANAAAAAGNTKKRDDNLRKFLKDASNAVGRLITTAQMATLTRVANAISAS